MGIRVYVVALRGFRAGEKGFSHSGKYRGMDRTPGGELAWLAPLNSMSNTFIGFEK